jgi:hypothetical protein
MVSARPCTDASTGVLDPLLGQPRGRSVLLDDGDQKCSPHRYLGMWQGNSWSQAPGGDTLEGAYESGDGDRGRVVHEQVDVIAFAVELPQLRAEVGAHVAHDLFTAPKDLFWEWSAPVPGSEDRVRIEGVDDATAPADIGVRRPAW